MSLNTENSVERGATTFRGDLVGLRAVAVLAVLLHHFQIPGFAGAFYGPDIFFVLSGYLITGSLVREYARSMNNGTQRGSISFIGLYLRRVRRIIPAATFVIVAINIYAYFFVNELKAKSIYLDSIWTFFFGANIRFAHEATDYFAVERISPLVHFWSLSVTEQFYLVWPVLLILAARIRIPGLSTKSDAWKKQMVLALSVLILVSFIWSLIVFKESRNLAYFSTFCRAWELAVGGAIAILSFSDVQGKKKQTVGTLRNFSLVLLFGSILIVKESNFAYTIFLPVVACAFLIFSAKQFEGDPSSKILGSKPLTALGTISYSVYLWHWPIFAFAQELGLMETLANKFLGILMTIPLGVFTYRYIEQTFMRIKIPSEDSYADKNLDPKKIVIKRVLVTTSLLLVLVVPANAFLKPMITANSGSKPPVQSDSSVVNVEFLKDYGVKTQNLSFEQWQESVKKASTLTKLPAQASSDLRLLDDPKLWSGHGFECAEITKRKSKYCANGSPQSNQDAAAKKVVVLGSSAAQALFPAVAQVFNPKIFNLRGYISPGCSIADVQNTAKDGSPNLKCNEFRQWSVDEINKVEPDFIVISAHDRWVPKMPELTFRDRLERSLNRLKNSKTKIILVGVVPLTANLRSCLSGKTNLGAACFTSPHTYESRRLSQEQAVTSVGGTYIDPIPWMCADEVCPPVINNMIVSWDGTHLTTWFSKYIGRFLKAELEAKRVIE